MNHLFISLPKWVLLVTVTGLVNSENDTSKRNSEASSNKKVVCYYTNWSVYRPGTAKFTPQNINPYLCTHLIYAFVGLDHRENGLRPYDKYQDMEQGGYAKFTGLKTYNKNLKTMVAIGGWNEGSTRFSPLVANEERRKAFVKNALKFLRQNNFDGLDLDWEYPAFRDGGKPADKENYAKLVQELREEFDKEASKTGKPRLLLTMAVPAGVDYIDKGYDIPKLNRYLDFMNILSYDYHSAFEPTVNHHSPLYSVQEENEYSFENKLNIDSTVKHYLKAGVDSEKLILGIPTYGRTYTLLNPDSTDLGSPADGPGEQGDATREKGYLAYYEICSNFKKDDNWNIVHPRSTAMGPYAHRENQWVSYDDENIVKLKAQYVVEKGLGGIMFWSIDNDDFRGKCHKRSYPLIEAGKEALLLSTGSSTTVAPTEETKKPKPGRRKHRPKIHRESTTTSTTTAATTSTTTTTTTVNPLSTPEPPTTPDPGTDFACKDEGFFPHPRDCRKYFWCLDSGPSNLGIVAHQFTCPSGLLFNEGADSCDYARNVVCNKKEKSTTTSTTSTTAAEEIEEVAASTTKRSKIKLASATSTTTTSTTSTTTTQSPPIEEEEDYEEDDEIDSQEDPETIKQLITLIKKLGGISELEKQLKLNQETKEDASADISKNLYDKVFSGQTSNRFHSKYPNGPSGPQNQGLLPSDDSTVPYRKEKPAYVTIQRNRPQKDQSPSTDEDTADGKNKVAETSSGDEIEESDVSEQESSVNESHTPKYAAFSRTRGTTSEGRTSTTARYVVLERNKTGKKAQTLDEESDVETSTPSSTTHRYITLVRQRTTTSTPSLEERTNSPTVAKVEDIGETTEKQKAQPSSGRSKSQFRRLGVTSRSHNSTTQQLRNVRNENDDESRFNRRRKPTSTRHPVASGSSPAVSYDSEPLKITVNRGRKFETNRHVPAINRSSTSTATYFLRENTNSATLDDSEVQNLNPQIQTASSDTDLANVAVVAIHNLKTLPPASFSSVTTNSPISVTFPKSKTNIMTSTPDGAFSKQINHRRGSLKLLKTTTTTSSYPYTQDIYSDYRDPEGEFHAEPIDIPITGKVRIHRDGYIECLDMGNFPHPFSCRKFISCAKMEYGSLLGWEYTCPKGLSFDPIGGICNWAAGLGCRE